MQRHELLPDGFLVAAGQHEQDRDASIPESVAADRRDRAVTDDANPYHVIRKKPLSVADNGLQKRGRRDSNPQPPDRQSGLNSGP